MDINNARKFYNLKECPNKTHFYTFFKLHFSWTWAEDYWSFLDDGGFANDLFLDFGRVRNKTGQEFYRIIIWKLVISFATLK